jgi:hypothetical protein
MGGQAGSVAIPVCHPPSPAKVRPPAQEPTQSAPPPRPATILVPLVSSSPRPLLIESVTLARQQPFRSR